MALIAPPALKPGSTLDEQRTFMTQATGYVDQLSTEPHAAADSDLRVLVDGLQRVADDVDRIARATLLRRIAGFVYAEGKPMVGLVPALEAVRLCRTAGDKEQLARSLGILSLVLRDTTDLKMALQCLEEALTMHQKEDWIRVALLSHKAACYHMARKWNEAEKAIQLALALNKRLGIEFGKETLYEVASKVARDKGDLEAAKHFCASAVEAADASISNPHHPPLINMASMNRLLCYCLAGQLALRCGDVHEAEVQAGKARALAQAGSSPRAMLDVEMLEGGVLVAMGNAEVGISRLQDVLDRSREMRANLADALQALVDACHTAGRTELVVPYQRELALIARQYKDL